MYKQYHWRNVCWSACLALVLAGCRQGETPKVPIVDAPAPAPQGKTPAVVEPAPKETTPAKPAPPASLEEATRVIDLRKFPIIDGGKDVYKSADDPKPDRGKDLRTSAVEVQYVLRRVDGAQVAQFYRTNLAEAGWKLADGHIEPGYFSFTGSKQSFFLSGGVYVNKAAGELIVRITNHGNVDGRTLPRFAGAELMQNDAELMSYRTDAKPEEVLNFTRAELEKRGWREAKLPAKFKSKSNPRARLHARFIQRGIHIDTYIEVQEGKTEVRYQVRFLRVELPIMPEVQGDVEFLDGEKSLLHLFYAVPAAPEKVLEFYRKELPAVGWTIRTGSDTIANGKAKVTLDAPEKESLRLELLEDSQGTFVFITTAPEGK